MNGNKYLADTNAFIYLLRKHPAIMPLIEAEWCFSFISRIELLGKIGITPSEIDIVKNVLAISSAMAHNDQINELTIKLKQQYKIKTPDAIIAATGIYYNIPLLTADNDFTRIEELDLVLIEL